MIKKLLILFFAVSFLCTTGFGQGKWELKRHENGIEVYTRKPASGSLKELRVICKLKCTKTKLIKTLQDINNYKNWVYSTKTNKILNAVSPNEMIYYSISKLPWPLKNRDLIVQLTVLPTTFADKFEIQAKSLPDYLPKEKDFIRVPYSLALWKVSIAGDKELNIDYTFSVDPGGSIPTWLVNATLAVGPYNSFLKLQELVSRSN